MCGRYALHQSSADLRERYNLATSPKDVRENYNVAPGQIMPVITKDEDGKTRLEMMKWGLIPFWAKDPNIGYKMINARAETIFDKPAWRSVVLRKRCLIPADGFYEWLKENDAKGKVQKRPYYIHPKQENIFSFAGVWETWKDSNDNVWMTYSIITTDANKEMRAVHDRMPVILHPEDEASWLEPSSVTRDSIEPLLRPLEDNALELYEVSSDVNVTRSNDNKLILPLNSQ